MYIELQMLFYHCNGVSRNSIEKKVSSFLFRLFILIYRPPTCLSNASNIPHSFFAKIHLLFVGIVFYYYTWLLLGFTENQIHHPLPSLSVPLENKKTNCQWFVDDVFPQLWVCVCVCASEWVYVFTTDAFHDCVFLNLIEM